MTAPGRILVLLVPQNQAHHLKNAMPLEEAVRYSCGSGEIRTFERPPKGYVYFRISDDDPPVVTFLRGNYSASG
jgi:hypothetical protein